MSFYSNYLDRHNINTRFKRRIRYQQGFNQHHIFMVAILSLIIFACTSTSKSNLPQVTVSSTETPALKVWWDKGFNLDEDEALQRLVNNWEKQTGNKIKVSLHTNEELPRKVERAIQSGNLPDILIIYNAEIDVIPRLAWEGELADISDVIQPMQSFFPDAVLKAVYFYNKVAKKHSYYALPLHQSTIHIFYWRDLLQQIKRSDRNIPQDWDSFWNFWKQVQNDLEAKQKHNKKQKIYGFGFTFSVGSLDTYYLFEQVLEAYDVQILDSQGKLLIEQPNVREGIIKSLDWYAKFYQQGYVPTNALNWLNADNNHNLLNRLVIMTPNPSLSIPVAVREDRDTYLNKLGIAEFPNKPSGKPMHHLVSLREAILFAKSKNQKIAKDFLAYLSQPQVTLNYLKTAGGRLFPVLKPALKDPFWTNPADPHISTAAKTLIDGQTRLFSTAQNPAYGLILKENVWGKAVNDIIVNGITPQQAADEAIARIKQIFAQWR